MKTKKKEIMAIWLGCIIFFTSFNFQMGEVYADNVQIDMVGKGTEENPYQVSTAEQLNEVRNHLNACYIQTRDINLSVYDNWDPIGRGDSKNDVFKGKYDGNNYVIRGLNITDPKTRMIGLFGGCSSNAEIQNVYMENMKIKYNSDYKYKEDSVVVGGIVGGYIDGDSSKDPLIKNCTVKGDIEVLYTGVKSVYVGGIVGCGTAAKCHNYATILANNKEINGYSAVGGITGHTGTVYGKVTSCKNYGKIQSNSTDFLYIGGIAGEDGDIKQCINYGDITGTVCLDTVNCVPATWSICAGGIVGKSSGNIVESANYGNVESYSDRYLPSAGGIAGCIGFYAEGKISNCYSLGKNITAKEDRQNGHANRIAGVTNGYSQIFYSNYAINSLKINDNIADEKECEENTINGKTIEQYPKLDYESDENEDNLNFKNNVYYINSVDSNQIILDALPCGYDDSKVSIESIKPYVGKYAYIEFNTSASPKVIGIKAVKSSFGTITNYAELNSSGGNDSIEIDQKEFPVSNENISVIDGRNSRVLYHTIDDKIVGLEFLKTSIGYYNGTTENGEEKIITVSNKEYDINSVSCIPDEIETGYPVVFSVGTKNNSDEICPFLLEVQKLQGTPSVWVYVSDDTFSTEIGQELDLYCALHIGDYVIPNWEKPSFAVGNDKLVTLSNYEQTDLGYHCKIKGVTVGETSLTITDTETGAHQSFPIRVKDKTESVPYSCRISEVPDYTIESGWDKGLQTNIYNANGLYVNKYKYEKNEAGGYDVSFDVYNSLYMHGSVDVYDKDGRWIQSEKINKLTGITSLYSTGESLVYLIDDALQQKSLTYEATTYTKKTGIKIIVPEDGYFVISTNYVDSPGVMLYNSMDIIMLGLDATISSMDKVDCSLNLEKYLSDAKEKKLHEALQKAIDSKTKKFLSDQLKEGMTAGYGEAANVIVLQGNEILTAEKLDDNFYKDTLGVGEDVLLNYMGPAGAALKLMFGIQKYADYTLQIGQICKGISKSEIVISATSAPSIHGITVKPDNPAAIGEAVLQVFRVSDNNEIASSFENAIPTQTNQYEIYNICFTKENVEQEINTNVTVRIPIPETFDKNKSAIFRQEKDGSWTKLDSKIDGNYLVFETNHFSLYAIAESSAVDEPATTLISSITLNMKNGIVAKDGTLKLNATTSPSNATNPTLLWSSDTPSVATVDQTGLVTAVNAGKATIIARAQDGSGVEASCVVEVTSSSNIDDNNKEEGSSLGNGNTSTGGSTSSGNTGGSQGGSAGSGNTGGSTTGDSIGTGNTGGNTGGSTDSSNTGDSTTTGNTSGNTEEITENPSTGDITKGDKITKGNTTYTVINPKTKELSYTKTTSKSSKITIPAKVKIDGVTYKVTKIANNAFKNNKYVTKIVLGSNITEIGDNAFKRCLKLKSITITPKVKVIGSNAFSGDKKLTVLTIKSGKLTKKGVKNSLKGSSIQTIKLSGTAQNYYKKYLQYFTKSNSGKTVKIKK